MKTMFDILSLIFQVASKYGMPPEMIKNVYKKTKKGYVKYCEHQDLS